MALQNVQKCGYWVKNVAVKDKAVTFYISITGNSWSVALKNSAGAVEATATGSSYGNQTLTATSYGYHTLELTCNWGNFIGATRPPCEVCPVDIPVPPPQPVVIQKPAGTEVNIQGQQQNQQTAQSTVDTGSLQSTGSNPLEGFISNIASKLGVSNNLVMYGGIILIILLVMRK